jgi:glyoxylase-like metal-dependent hydrolase (beta-lactamase superfamily II)
MCAQTPSFVRAVVVAVGLLVVLTTGCTHNLRLLPPPPAAAAATTAGPFSSLIFAARTDSGVMVIDLGWGRAAHGLRSALARIDADTADVRYAFLTHAHRDHIGAWPAVAHATFVMGAAEVPLFVGDSAYRGFGSRVGEFFNDAHRPSSPSVVILPLGGDTAFAFGRDTLRAFALPGHTPGSTAYLFRGTLFVGDAAYYTNRIGFQGALRVFSDDVDRSRASMRALFARLDSAGLGARTLCTAHAKCGEVTAALRERLTR